MFYGHHSGKWPIGIRTLDFFQISNLALRISGFIPLTLPLVAAAVRRRSVLRVNRFRLLTAAATALGLKARN